MSVPQHSNDTLVPKSSPGIPHICKPMGSFFQQQMENCGPFDPELKRIAKTRKFAEFSAGEEVATGRATSPNHFHHPNLESSSTGVTALDYLLPSQTILSSVGQPTTRSPEHHGASLNLPHLAIPSESESLPTSLQAPGNPGFNTPMRNWPHALLTTCVVGVAVAAVVTRYACRRAVRGAMNVGQLFYSNRQNIQQTCAACTQAVQSTYNAAKRRIVSVRRIPVGVRRRYALPPILQGRSRQRYFPRQYRTPEQLTQSVNPVAPTSSPERMQGVEYNIVPSIPPTPASPNAAASDALVIPPTAAVDLRRENSPPVTFDQSPRTGRPVNQTRIFVKDEPIGFPVDYSSLKASPIIQSVGSPTRKGRDAKGSRAGPPIGDGRSSPSLLIAPKAPSRRKPPRAKGRKKKAAQKNKAAKLRQEKEAAEAAEATERARVAAEEAAQKEAEEEDQRLKRDCRRTREGKLIQPLDAKWEQIVQDAMATPSMQDVLVTASNGAKLTRRDLGTLKVVQGRDPPRGWLNDEIISACLQQVVDYGLQASNHKVSETPKYHAFNTFFYTNIREKGAESVRRWATRAKIGKENLLKVERLFIPVHSGAHWSLLVVSPIARTIEYFDSLGGLAHPYILHAKAWLSAELGKLYKEDEWTVPTGSLGAGPQQSNSSDCGVFACTNARMVVLGVNPMAYAGSDMELQRTRMVAELLNGGLKGDLEPRVVF